MRFVDANQEAQLRDHPAEVITVGSSIPGKDVAVLKINARRLPECLPLGDESNLEVGDQIYIIGFPGSATFHPMLSKTSVAEATFTRGIISAKKTAIAGWTILQHDASNAPGNSGGPAVDSSGKVIGIHTFGSMTQAGEKVQGHNFIVPILVVREFLDRAGVKTETGPQGAQRLRPAPSTSPTEGQTGSDTGDDSALERRR